MDNGNDAPSLMLHGVKTLPSAVRARLWSCCPTMDLVAVVCQTAQLEVYRFNGQRAFMFQPVNASSTISSICWKFNGQSIAVGWENGEVDVLSAETGKVSHHFQMPQTVAPVGMTAEPQPVAAIAWGLNFINASPVKAKIESCGKTSTEDAMNGSSILAGFAKSDGDDVSLEDFLARLPDPKLLDMDQSLPDQLALLDIDSHLPKLPVLPVLPGSAGLKPSENLTAETFASQASLDAALHPHNSRDANTADVLLALHGCIFSHPILYGSLPLRPLKLPPEVQNASPLICASHPFSCSYNILAKVPSSTTGSAAREDWNHLVVPLKVSFIRSAGKYLHIISSKTARLQNVVHYISACLNSLNYHWRHSQELPGKFMRIVSETLAEQEEMGLVENLFHLAATGNCPPTIKEWLVEQLTERGHKRWDHAVSLGYSKLVDITHENLLPALDRCAILLSNLRGFASYHEGTGIFDIEPNMFTKALEAVHCLRLLCFHLLYFASRERTSFANFSKWLRHEIDVQGSETSAPEETAEQSLDLDFEQVLSYIRGPLVASRTRPFVEISSSDVSEGPGMTDPSAIAAQIERLRRGDDPGGRVLNLEAHFSFLNKTCASIFERIVEWQLKGTAFKVALRFEETTRGVQDMRMVSEEIPGLRNHVTTYLASASGHVRDELNLYRVVHHETFDDANAIKRIERLTVHCNGKETRDVKFADDERLVALLEGQDGSLLVSWRYRQPGPSCSACLNFEAAAVSRHNFADSDIAVVQIHRHKATDDGLVAWNPDTASPHGAHVMHVFPIGEHFKPLSIDVNGRRGRRVICVLGQDLKTYKIFDLDSTEADAGETTLERVGKDEDTIMSE